MANRPVYGPSRRGKPVKVESFAGALENQLKDNPLLDPQMPITFNGQTKEAGIIAWEYVQNVPRDNQLAPEGKRKRDLRAEKFVEWYKRLSPEG